MQPLYDPEAVRPMWEELAQCGVTPLKTAADIDEALGKPGTTLIVVNSVCGCAAGGARPGVTQALQAAVIPDHLTTVFAGVDMEATQHARAHAGGCAIVAVRRPVQGRRACLRVGASAHRAHDA